MDDPDIFSEDPRKEFQYILLTVLHCLRPVSQDGHPAWKHFFQQQILNSGIILHLVHHQMPDPAVDAAPVQRIFQIKKGINVLIREPALFRRPLRQGTVSFAFQETAVKGVTVPRTVHLHEFSQDFFPLLIGQISLS